MSTDLGAQVNANARIAFNIYPQKAVLSLVQIFDTPYGSVQGLHRWRDQFFDL